MEHTCEPASPDHFNEDPLSPIRNSSLKPSVNHSQSPGSVMGKDSKLSRKSGIEAVAELSLSLQTGKKLINPIKIVPKDRSSPSSDRNINTRI